LKKLGKVSQKKDPEAVDKDHLLSDESGSLIRIAPAEKNNCREDGRQDCSRKKRSLGVQIDSI